MDEDDFDDVGAEIESLLVFFYRKEKEKFYFVD